MHFTEDNIQIISVQKDCFHATPWDKSLDPERWVPPVMVGPDPIVNINIPEGYFEGERPNGYTNSLDCEVRVDGKSIRQSKHNVGFASYEYDIQRGQLKSLSEDGTYILLNLYEVDGTKSHDVTVCCEGVCDTKIVGPCEL